MISAVIIAKNEEANLPGCLESVRWADEIILIDSNSTDRTVEIARAYGAMVFQVEWRGFGHAKGFGIEKAASEWIFSIDADERITPDLAAEIKEAVKLGRYSGYYLPRRTNFLGRWIRYSRWYPDYVLRLFQKNKGSFSSSLVHEKATVDGPVGRLHNPILHYSYPDIETYFRKFERYTALGAEELYRNGKKFSAVTLVLKSTAAFLRHYVTGAGFLDGVEGFLIASFSALSVMTKYIKLRSLERSKEGATDSSH